MKPRWCAFRPSLEEFLAILEAHAKREGQAIGLAARHASKSGTEALETAVQTREVFAATKGDAEPDACYQPNLRFHESVAVATGNPFLTEVIKTNATNCWPITAPIIAMPHR